MKNKYSRKQITEAIAYWENKLQTMISEASAEEGNAYRRGMMLMGRNMSQEILKVWDKYVSCSEITGDQIIAQKGESYPFIEVICALAEYVKNMPNATSIDREMAEKFGQIGAAYMI